MIKLTKNNKHLLPVLSIIKRFQIIGVFIVCIFFTVVYFYPMFQGLILLPLDLLIANHGPWMAQSEIFVKNNFLEDSITQMYPWKYIVFQSLQNGIIPFWNPYTFMGTPFLASMKPMVFYPLTVLFFKLGTIYGWNALLFSQVLLALFFTYLFIREYKLPIFISFFGSIVYACSSLMMAVLPFGSEGHVLLWFPLLFFAIKRFYDKKNWWTLPLLSFGTASSILAGQLQYFLYGFLTIIAFILFYGRFVKASFRQYVLIFLSLLFGIGISTVQLLPSIELLKYANRSKEASQDQFIHSLLQPIHLFRFLSPDFFGNPVQRNYSLNYIEGSGYIGIIPLFFFLYSLFHIKKMQHLRFFLFMAAIGILMSMEFFGKYLPLTHIQFLYYGAGYRIFSLFYLPAALFSSFGLYWFLRDTNNILKRKILLFFFTFSLLIFTHIFFFQNISSQYAFSFTNVKFQIIIVTIFTIVAFLFLLLSKNTILKTLFICFIIGLTFIDLFRMQFRFQTYASPAYLFPKTEIVTYLQNNTKSSLHRIFGMIEPEHGPIFQLSTPQIYNPLYLERSRKTVEALAPHAIYNGDSTTSYLLSGMKSKELKYAVDVLGIKYIIVERNHNPSTDYFGTPAFNKTLFPAIYYSNKYAVHPNKQAYPRFGVFYNVVPASGGDHSLQLLKEKKYDLHKYLIVESPGFIPKKNGKGNAKVLSYTMNDAKFSVESSQPGYFYLSDTFYPGWTATVNKKQEPILRANANFRAVKIPAGKSLITFNYSPTNFTLSVVISIISMILAFLVPIFLILLYPHFYKSK